MWYLEVDLRRGLVCLFGAKDATSCSDGCQLATLMRHVRRGFKIWFGDEEKS